jgi:hypothetical protein
MLSMLETKSKMKYRKPSDTRPSDKTWRYIDVLSEVKIAVKMNHSLI